MTKQSKCSECGNPIYAYTSVKVGKCYRCRGKKKMQIVQLTENNIYNNSLITIGQAEMAVLRVQVRHATLSMTIERQGEIL